MANPPPRSFALAETRRRYESTPRALDDDLVRMSRGDRGCLGDAISGIGAVGILITGMLGYLGYLGYGFMAFPAAMLIGGFFLSAAAQTRSGPLRHQALTQGPLVLARVLRADPAVREPGDATHPALVVFAVDPPHHFDVAYLHQIAGPLLALPRRTDIDPELAPIVAMLRDPAIVEPLRLPAALAGPGEAYLGVVSIDPRRLPARRVEDDIIPVIAAPALGFVEHV